MLSLFARGLAVLLCAGVCGCFAGGFGGGYNYEPSHPRARPPVIAATPSSQPASAPPLTRAPFSRGAGIVFNGADIYYIFGDGPWNIFKTTTGVSVGRNFVAPDSAITPYGDIAVDENYLYYFVYSIESFGFAPKNTLRKQPLDGGPASDVIINTPNIVGIGASDVYVFDGTILTTVPRGDGVVDAAISGVLSLGLATDAEYFYIANSGTAPSPSGANPTGTVTRRPIAGGAAQLLAGGRLFPSSVALSVGGVFWLEGIAPLLVECGPVQSSVMTLSSTAVPPRSLGTFAGTSGELVVDTARAYWSASACTGFPGSPPSEIMSASIGGGDVRALLSVNAPIQHLAVDDTSVYFVTADGTFGEITK